MTYNAYRSHTFRRRTRDDTSLGSRRANRSSNPRVNLLNFTFVASDSSNFLLKDVKLR